MVSTKTRVPVRVHLLASYEPDMEFADREIEERPAGEFDHTWRQPAITSWFWQHQEQGTILTRTQLGIRADIDTQLPRNGSFSLPEKSSAFDTQPLKNLFD